MRALGECEHRRTGQQQAVTLEHPQPEALPPRRDPPLGCQRGTSGLDQPAVRDTTGAGWLAAPALHARLYEVDERVVYGRVTQLDGAHRGDSPPRR